MPGQPPTDPARRAFPGESAASYARRLSCALSKPPSPGTTRTSRTRTRQPTGKAVRSGVQVGEDGQHPAVVVVRGRQAELGEDVVDVLADRFLGHEKLAGD